MHVSYRRINVKFLLLLLLLLLLLFLLLLLLFKSIFKKHTVL